MDAAANHVRILGSKRPQAAIARVIAPNAMTTSSCGPGTFGEPRRVRERPIVTIATPRRPAKATASRKSSDAGRTKLAVMNSAAENSPTSTARNSGPSAATNAIGTIPTINPLRVSAGTAHVSSPLFRVARHTNRAMSSSAPASGRTYGSGAVRSDCLNTVQSALVASRSASHPTCLRSDEDAKSPLVSIATRNAAMARITSAIHRDGWPARDRSAHAPTSATPTSRNTRKPASGLTKARVSDSAAPRAVAMAGASRMATAPPEPPAPPSGAVPEMKTAIAASTATESVGTARIVAVARSGMSCRETGLKAHMLTAARSAIVTHKPVIGSESNVPTVTPPRAWVIDTVARAVKPATQYTLLRSALAKSRGGSTAISSSTATDTMLTVRAPLNAATPPSVPSPKVHQYGKAHAAMNTTMVVTSVRAVLLPTAAGPSIHRTIRRPSTVTAVPVIQESTLAHDAAYPRARAESPAQSATVDNAARRPPTARRRHVPHTTIPMAAIRNHAPEVAHTAEVRGTAEIAMLATAIAMAIARAARRPANAENTMSSATATTSARIETARMECSSTGKSRRPRERVESVSRRESVSGTLQSRVVTERIATAKTEYTLAATGVIAIIAAVTPAEAVAVPSTRAAHSAPRLRARCLTTSSIPMAHTAAANGTIAANSMLEGCSAVA